MDIVLVYLSITLVLLLSAIIKGVSGFGTSLIAIPALIALGVMGPAEARALIVSINLVLNAIILASARQLTYAHAKPYMLLIASVFVAALLAGFLLPRVTATIFHVLMGGLLILTALNRFFDIRFTIVHPKRYYVPLGLVGGTLNTLIGAGSVPVLIFLANSETKKAEFRVTVSLFLLILNAGSLISFLLAGTYASDIALLGIAFAPVMIIGTFLGIRFQHRVNERVFKKLVAVLLFFIGVNGILNLFFNHMG